MKRLYKYLSLVGAKLVGRRHPKDVDIPGLKELKNAFISKSDSAITCRPDFDPVSESILSRYDRIQLDDENDDTSEFLNSAFGMYGYQSLAYIGKYLPVVYNSTTGQGSVIARTYSMTDVTATNSADSPYVVFAGNGTKDAVKRVWPGMIFAYSDDYGTEAYKVKRVISDEKVEMTTDIESAHSSKPFFFIENHQPDFTDYKINQQPFTSGAIYSCPTIEEPVQADKICGPFYGQATEATITVTESVGDAESLGDAAFDDLGTHLVCRIGDDWFMSLYGEDQPGWVIATTDTPEDHDSWTLLNNNPYEVADFAAALGYNIFQVYDTDESDYVLVVCGTKISTGEVALLVTADKGATPWTMIVHSEGSTGTAISIDSVTLGSSLSSTSYYVITYDEGGVGGTLVLSFIPYLDGLSGDWTDFDTGLTSFLQSGRGTFYYTLNGDSKTYYGIGLFDSSDGKLYVVNDTSSKTHVNTIDVGDDTQWGGLTHSYVRATSTGSGSYPASSIQTVLYGPSGTKAYAVIPGYSIDSQDGGIDSDDITYTVSGSWTYAVSDYRLFPNSGESFPIVAFINGPNTYVGYLKVYTTGNVYPFSIGSAPGSARPQGLAYYDITKEYVCKLGESEASSPTTLFLSEGTPITSWSLQSFAPLSNEIRAVTHSVLDGYVVLMNVREYDSDENVWDHYPRRIKWTAPLTYNDFSSSGSGTANLNGTGSILDSRTVNGRIVTFESAGIGAISPRGYTDDPWEYDQIKQNIRTISNPVVVDDSCYFIDDSGLLRMTNGITVEEPPFSLDLTQYDDFNADKPIWLVYSPELESLMVYNPSDSNRYVYVIEPGSGSVSRFQAATVDTDVGNAESPKSIVCVENSSDRRTFVCYNPITADTDELVVAELGTGDTITGIDEWTSEAGDDTYHTTVFETPEISLVPEGDKTSIKHIILRTYTDGTDQDTNPVIGIQVRSLEDSSWSCAGDTVGTITVDTDSCDGTGTAWSNTLGASGSTIYNTPCLATQARVYVGSSLQTAGTDYTITDTKEITFGSATGDTVYAYWENYPYVKVGVDDLIATTEGYHLITAVPDYNSLTLDHYLSTGSDATAVHIPAERMPVGDGEVKIGLNKLVEGVKIRVIIMHDSTGDATVTKVTGMTVGHIPAGIKIVEP